MSALLGVSAVILFSAIVSRFPPLGGVLPEFTSSIAALAVGAALGVVGAVERRSPRGTVGALWMQLPRPISLCMALGMSYFTTVFAQEFGVSLGPVDPTFPSAMTPDKAAMWFFVFTLGFVGVGMMSAPNLLVPLLRVVTRPTSDASAAASVVVSAALGLLFTAGLLVGLRNPMVVAAVTNWRAFFDANATAGTLALVAIGVVPGLLPSKKES